MKQDEGRKFKIDLMLIRNQGIRPKTTIGTPTENEVLWIQTHDTYGHVTIRCDDCYG